MTHSSAPITGKPKAATLSNPILAVIREHTQDPWEVDPADPAMAILRRPILDLVREHLPGPKEVQEVKAKAKVQKAKAEAPAKAPKKPPAQKAQPPALAPSDDSRRSQIFYNTRKAGSIAAKDVHYLWDGLSKKSISNKAGALLTKMVKEGVLVRAGKGPGTTYSLPVSEAGKKPPAKTTGAEE